jgi:hypothetical protein
MRLQKSKKRNVNQLRKRAALVLLVVLPLAACASPTHTLVTKKVALEAFEPIRASNKDTCETRRQIAAHNSAYDTLKTSKLTVYKVDCKKPKPPPKTS